MLSFTDLAATVAEADAYFTASGDAAWTGSDADKQAALLRGQRYIAGAYNARWVTPFESADAPEMVKFAIMEAAKAEIARPGSLTATSAVITRKREKVEGIERELEYRDGVRADGNTSGAEAIILGLLGSLIRSSSTTWLMRA